MRLFVRIHDDRSVARVGRPTRVHRRTRVAAGSERRCVKNVVGAMVPCRVNAA